MPETARKSAGWKYLLGTLSSDEEFRVEEGFFADDSDFEQLEIAEDELIDAYVNDELSPQERSQFETRLLTTQRIADRVKFARTLTHKARSECALDYLTPVFSKQRVKWWEVFFPRPASFPTAVAASVALILIGGGFILFSWLQLRRESQRIASERVSLQKQKEETDKLLLDQQSKHQQLAADLQRESERLTEERRRLDALQEEGNQGSSLPGAIIPLMLSPGLVRDENGQQHLTLGPHVGQVRLQLALESNEYRSYQATLMDAQHRSVFTRSGLTARKAATGGLVNLLVPANKLRPGNYFVTVRGRLPNGVFEDVEDYVFRISR